MAEKRLCACSKSIKEPNVPCPNKAKPDSPFCGVHKNCKSQKSKPVQKSQKKQMTQKKQMKQMKQQHESAVNLTDPYLFKEIGSHLDAKSLANLSTMSKQIRSHLKQDVEQRFKEREYIDFPKQYRWEGDEHIDIYRLEFPR